MSTSSEYDFAGHDERVRQHYDNAREKHPYFCDMVLWNDETCWTTGNLRNARKQLKDAIKSNSVCAIDDVIDCELEEVCDAIARGNTAHAVEELYDCVSVCLRTIDVLEGRQKLGRPETISGTSAGK